MTYAALVQKFLSMVEVIRRMNPAYKQPGDGTNGVCDCIGLIIGAIRRMGLRWTGIHGSNYAARYQTKDLKKITGPGVLSLGDIVYKARERGQAKYDLPSRYFKGAQYYNGDLKDYYHVGVVTQVSPLRITHMTSPTIKVDSSLGAWSWYGKAKPIVNASSGHPQPDPKPEPSTGSRAIVYADNGLPVKMREYPSTSCRTWEKLSCGTEVTISEPGEEWAKINANGRQGWYMMAKFLDVIDDGKGRY